MPELLLLIVFVVPLALWQFYDLAQAKKETARKREEAAARKSNDEQPGAGPGG